MSLSVAQRQSCRGGANSIEHRQTNQVTKHAPAARVQRCVGVRQCSIAALGLLFDLRRHKRSHVRFVLEIGRVNLE